MGHTNKNPQGSLRNVVIINQEQDFQLIDFKLLPFIPLKQNGIFSFRERNTKGLFIVKERDTNRISCIQSSGKCVYRIIRNASARFKLNGLHDLCVIECNKSLLGKAKKAVLDSHKKTSLFRKDFDFFKKNLISGRTIDLKKVPFVPVYKTREQMSSATKTDVRSSIVDFGKRSGVYVFKENGIVVYVGKSVNHLYATVYNHMLKQYDNYKKHNRARYNDTRHTHHYEVGLIEVLKQGRTNRSLAVTVGKLERFLIHQCNPRDNRQYRHAPLVSGKFEDFDEGDFWRPPVSNLNNNFLEEAPF